MRQWEQLPAVEVGLDGFALAATDRDIYRLGGVDSKVTPGASYHRRFSQMDLKTGRWHRREDAPFGTGGALLAVWPQYGWPVAIAGVDALGHAPCTDEVKVGLYDPVADAWKTRTIAGRDIGRPAALAWWRDGQFLLLTVSGDSDHGHRLAVLDLKACSLRTLGAFPGRGRVAGAAVVGRRLHAVCGLGDMTLWTYDFAEKAWWSKAIKGLPAAQACVPFAWRGGLYAWVSVADDKPSSLYRVDAASGEATMLDPGLSGPQVRRGTSGVLVGDEFHVCGGRPATETGSAYVRNAWRYPMGGRDPSGSGRPVSKESHLVGPVTQERLRWQRLPYEIVAVFVGPDKRAWYQLDHPARKENLGEVTRIIEREFAKDAPQIYGAAVALFEPGGRVWFRTHSQETLLGYNGKTWITHHAPTRRWFIGNCPGHGRAYGAGHNLYVDGKAFFIGSQGVVYFDGEAWHDHEMVNPHPPGQYPRLVPLPGGKGVLAWIPDTIMPIWMWREGKWEDMGRGGLGNAEYLREIAFCGPKTAWLFTPQGRIQRWNIEGASGSEVPSLVRGLGSPEPATRRHALTQLLRQGTGALSAIQDALAASADPAVRAALTRATGILGDAGWRKDESCAVGSVRVRKAKLRHYDPASGTICISGIIIDDERDLGPGLVVADAQEKTRILANQRFEPILSADTTHDSGCMLVDGGAKMWLPGTAAPTAAMLADLVTGRIVSGLPDCRYRYLHAIGPDGAVYASVADRHHTGVMAFRAEIPPPPEPPGWGR